MGKRKRKKTKKIISNIKEMQTLGLISAVNTVMCLFPHKSGSIFCFFFPEHFTGLETANAVCRM